MITPALVLIKFVSHRKLLLTILWYYSSDCACYWLIKMEQHQHYNDVQYFILNHPNFYLYFSSHLLFIKWSLVQIWISDFSTPYWRRGRHILTKHVEPPQQLDWIGQINKPNTHRRLVSFYQFGIFWFLGCAALMWTTFNMDRLFQ